MGEATGIAWTEKTWNPWQGCHKVSPGCKHCYMFSEKKRYGQEPNVVVRSKPPTFNAPKKWKDPALVFTCSWSDWFIEEADPFRDEAWEIIRATPHLTYQILTKRPERMAGHLPVGWPFPNVWLGVSVEDQAAARARIPWLVETPAAVRFVSAEPLLGPVDLARITVVDPKPPHGPGVYLDALTGHVAGPDDMLDRVDWVIVGGESGNFARPMHLDWARRLVTQCRAAGVACFVKQLGAKPRGICSWKGHDKNPGDWLDENGTLATVSGATTGLDFCHHQDDMWAPCGPGLADRKGGDPAEWPEDLRVRQMPEVAR